jgi:hypothetical protein
MGGTIVYVTAATGTRTEYCNIFYVLTGCNEDGGVGAVD